MFGGLAMEVAESHSGRVKVWARSAALAPQMCDAVSRSCAHSVCRFLERRPNMDPNQPNQPTGPQYPPNQTPGYQQPGYRLRPSSRYVPPPPPGPYSQPMGQQPYNQYGAPPPPQQPAADSLGSYLARNGCEPGRRAWLSDSHRRADLLPGGEDQPLRQIQWRAGDAHWHRLHRPDVPFDLRQYLHGGAGSTWA